MFQPTCPRGVKHRDEHQQQPRLSHWSPSIHHFLHMKLSIQLIPSWLGPPCSPRDTCGHKKPLPFTRESLGKPLPSRPSPLQRALQQLAIKSAHAHTKNGKRKKKADLIDDE